MPPLAQVRACFLLPSFSLLTFFCSRIPSRRRGDAESPCPHLPLLAVTDLPDLATSGTLQECGGGLSGASFSASLCQPGWRLWGRMATAVPFPSRRSRCCR